MADFVGLTLGLSLDPIRAIFILLIMIFIKKHTPYYIFACGIILGVLGVWLVTSTSSVDVDSTRHMLASLVAAFITYGIFYTVNKIRLYLFTRGGYTYKKEDDYD